MTTPKKTRAVEAADIQVPTMGRIVHYTDANGDVMPAIVTAVEAKERPQEPEVTPVDESKDKEREKREGREGGRFQMHLQGWHSVMGCGHHFVEDVTAAARDESGEANTWNWPPKVGELPGDKPTPAPASR